MENPIMGIVERNNNDNNHHPSRTNSGKGRTGGGKGRRKVEMKKIEEKTSLIVTFSKRRTGLFKKIKNLTDVCKKKAAVVVFSPSGKPFVVGYPSVDSVVETYLRKRGGGEQEEEGFWWERSIDDTNGEELKRLKDALVALSGNLEARLDELRNRDEQTRNFLGILDHDCN